MAVATGKIDALFYILGLMVGLFAFGEIFVLIKSFFNAGAMGPVTIPQLLHLPYGLLVLVVVLLAVAGFIAAGVVERKLAAGKEEHPS